MLAKDKHPPSPAMEREEAGEGTAIIRDIGDELLDGVFDSKDGKGVH